MHPKRLTNIDGLRAVAALSVLVEHMLGDMLRATSGGAFRPVAAALVDSFSLGRFGVALFFLISGFVVPFSIRDERPLLRFAVSRVFRLYPAMWTAIGLLTLLAWDAGRPPPAAAVAANLSMMPALFGRGWLDEAYWTLFVELLFYGLAAALFASGLLRNVGAVLLAGLALAASTVLPVVARENGIAAPPVLYLGLHVSFLLSGLLLRLAVMEGRRGAGAAAAVLLLAQFAAVPAVSGFSLARGDHFVIGGTLPVLSAYVAAAALFVAAVASGRPRVGLLTRLGAISYAIYLFHGPVDGLVYRVLPLTGAWSDLATMAVCTAATLAVACAVYLMIEKPMIRRGHRAAHRLATLRRGPIGFGGRIPDGARRDA